MLNSNGLLTGDVLSEKYDGHLYTVIDVYDDVETVSVEIVDNESGMCHMLDDEDLKEFELN